MNARSHTRHARSHVSVVPCHLDAFPGYRCVRGGHEGGGCEVVPRWWNLLGLLDAWHLRH